MQPFNHKTQPKNEGKTAWKIFERLNGCDGARVSAVSGSTDIALYLPEDTKSAHMVFVSTGNGRVLKEVPLNGDGIGQIKVNVSELPAGNYSYSLVVNGKQELSRQMILGK